MDDSRQVYACDLFPGKAFSVIFIIHRLGLFLGRGVKISNFNILGGGGVFRMKMNICWGTCMKILGASHNWIIFRGHFGLLKFQIFSGVLEILIFF